MSCSLVVGIAGCPSSGKSTVTKNLAQKLSDSGIPTVILNLDCFFLDFSQLSLVTDISPHLNPTWKNWELPTSVKLDSLYHELTQLLKQGTCEIPKYVGNSQSLNFFHQEGTTKKTIDKPGTIVIVEGFHVLYDDRVRAMFNLKVFLETGDWDVIWKRRSAHQWCPGDYTSQETLYFDEVLKPSYEKYILPTRQYADLIVNSQQNDIEAVANIVTNFVMKSYQNKT